MTLTAAAYRDDCIRRVVVHEGGYTNHPSDSGGPTNWGITIHDARRHWRPNATAADVKAMPLEVAVAIYAQKYWNVLRCDELPRGFSYALFDYGVNSGVGRAGKVLRRLLSLADNTSAVTDAVVRATNLKDADDLINALCDERLAFMHVARNKKGELLWPIFGRGWGRRVAEVRAAAHVMSKARPDQVAAMPTAPSSTTNSDKAVVEAPDAAKKEVKVGTAGAAFVSGVTFWDWIAAHPVEVAAIAVIAVCAVLLLFHALGRLHKRRQEAAPEGWEPPKLQEVAPQLRVGG